MRGTVLGVLAAALALVCATAGPELADRGSTSPPAVVDRTGDRTVLASGAVVGAAGGAAGGGRAAAAGTTTTPPDAQAPSRPDKPIYLTFDDGPSPTWTPKVLAVLRRYHARATFFEIGMEVRRFPQTAASVRAAGMDVGNHSSHHRNLTKLKGAKLAAEIDGGPAGATCLRPPYGDVDARVRAAVHARHLHVVLWDVDTEDWAEPGTKHVVHEALHGARPGRVILFHDGGGDRHETVAALRQVLPALARQGYAFEPVPGC